MIKILCLLALASIAVGGIVLIWKCWLYILGSFSAILMLLFMIATITGIGPFSVFAALMYPWYPDTEILKMCGFYLSCGLIGVFGLLLTDYFENRSFYH